MYTEPSFSCGILYLVSSLIRKNPAIQALVLKQCNLNIEAAEEDDEEEKYVDAKIDDEVQEHFVGNGVQEETKTNTEEVVNKDASVEEVKEEEKVNTNVPSWFHRTSRNTKNSHDDSKYNPLKRNPLYAGGDFCAYEELVMLRNHFHPTISLFAGQILNGKCDIFSFSYL